MNASRLPARRAVVAFTFFALFSASTFALDSADQKFATQAAAAGLAEVELADLAQQKATRDSVKQYADHLKQDHQQANEKLKSLAAQKGVQLPSGPDSKHKKEKERLAKLQGAQFDKAYVDAMVKDHKAVINDFEREAKKGNDAELKEFAAQTLPKLREHLDHAQKLQSEIKASGKSS